MGSIIISQNISLDGVTQDPTGDAGFKHGGWFEEISETDREAWAAVELEEARATEALLLGRRSYEYFAPRWSPRTGEWADRLNTLPKYVVSSTLTEPSWNNTTVLQGDPIDEIASLKKSVDGEIVTYASSELVPALLAHNLVDELRLIIYPFLLGGQHSLLRNTTDKLSLRLKGVRRVGDGLAQLTYALA